MPGITLEQAEQQLTESIEAHSAVLAGQQVRRGDKWLTRADLDAIQRSIDFWDKQVRRLSGGGLRIIGGTPT